MLSGARVATDTWYLWRRLDYASPEILRGEFYTGKEQDVWAYGVVAYVLLVGECPFATAADAQMGLIEGSTAWEALDARCARGCELEGEEEDGGVGLQCGLSRPRGPLALPALLLGFLCSILVSILVSMGYDAVPHVVYSLGHDV